MALDEALLESMPRLGRPVLRFYGWTEPAATFGYFQKYADVERATHLRPLIRRPTGGGIVPHNADWTYSLAFPPGHEWHSLKAEAKLPAHSRMDSSGVHQTRRDHGTRVRPSPISRHPSPVKGLFFRPRKIRRALAREKNRRRGTAAEQTGSADSRLGAATADSPVPPDWQKAMCAVGRVEWGAAWSDFVPDEALRARAEFLAQQKYSQAAHNRKR